MDKVRWGILGAAAIAREKVIPALQNGRLTEVGAIASRSLEKAQAVSEAFDIPKAYGAYGALLADPGIQAVYIPLPNHMHVEWACKAMQAGKHVLCEKPVSTNLADARDLLDMSQKYPDLKVMEAFMYRFHPQWQKVREMIASGRIGVLTSVQVWFSFYDDAPDSIVNNAAMGGGALLDIGCYGASVSRFLFGREPQRVCGHLAYDPQFQVDRLGSAILDFGTGMATFTCATQLSESQRVSICGTSGAMEIMTPFMAPPDEPCTVSYQHGPATDELVFEPCDQYTIQGDLFSEAILDAKEVPTPLEDAVANMQVIEAIRKSAAKHKWCDVPNL